MNRIYRLIWNVRLGTYAVASEVTKGRGKGSLSVRLSGLVRGGRWKLKALRAMVRWALGIGGLALAGSFAQATPVLPSGGHYVAGSGGIVSSNNGITVNQSTSRGIINWASFSIGPNGQVQFNNGSGATLNRVTGGQMSTLLGTLSATGSVYLINPEGVLVGPGASINTGGSFVASTLDVSNGAFMAGGALTFAGNSSASVVNQGTIKSANGDIFLLARTVENDGTLSAPNGTVGLGAGQQILLQDSTSDQRIFIEAPGGNATNAGSIAAASAELKASGGNVYALAGNTDGQINVTGTATRNGEIWLVADNGTVNVDSNLSARNADGSGGNIDTSGETVNVTGGTINTYGGNWLIDPTDYTIAPSGGDITGALLSSELASTNITIESSEGASGTSGNINVDDTVSWSSNKLTLEAQNDINVNSTMNASGSASLELEYGLGAVASGNTSTINVNAPINLEAGNNVFSTLQGSNGAVINYTVIDSLGAQNSETGTDLQGIEANLSGNYVLGANIDATVTSTWNGGFNPIGDGSTPFTGIFNGLDHTISNLTIDRPSASDVGLFGDTGSASAINNVGLLGASVSGSYGVGGLVGNSSGTVSNSYAAGSVIGSGAASFGVGGAIGANYGTISNSYATASVSGSQSSDVGGLVGLSHGTISNSYATGLVSGSGGDYIGGLIGFNFSGTISNSYATGSVSGPQSTEVGGLAGINFGAIDNSYAIGSVSGTGQYIGGLVGTNGGTISTSYAVGLVSGSSYVGGLVGYNVGSITSSYWNKSVNATGIGTGSTSGATGLTTSQMQTASNFSGFDFTTTPGASGNAWVMVDVDGTLNNAGNVAGAVLPMLASEYSTTITNVHQLELMGMAPSASYTLGTNVSATTTAGTGDVFGSSGFIPVGNGNTAFSGSFNGAGYTISGLSINIAGANFEGLFGNSSGAISNVNLTAAAIIGSSNYVGALVGINSGSVTEATSSGTVTGTNFVGGLVGYNNTSGTLTSDTSTATVSGNAGGFDAGGLVGINLGTITTSTSSGHASGSYGVGGLTGENDGTITQSTNSANASGTDYVGGLAGINRGIIETTSTSNATIDGTNYAGGLVGINFGTIETESSSAGSVAGTYFIGGVVGYNVNGGTLSETSSAATVTGATGGYDVGGLAGINFGTINDESSSSGTVSGSYGVGGLAGGNNGTITQSTSSSHVSGTNYVGGLVGINESVIQTQSSSSGTATGTNFVGGLVGYNDTPATITNGSSTATAIGNAGGFDVGGLVGINLGTVTTSTSSGHASGSYGVGGLTGENDGTVTQSTNSANATGTNYVGGLAGINRGTIETASTSNATINGTNYAGGLVGINFDTIETESSSAGHVAGTYFIGGVVGYNVNGGTLSETSSTAIVTGAAGGYDVGGLAGINFGTVNQSSSSGAVSGTYGVGGLVGGNNGTITQSTSSSSVTASIYEGGLVGINAGTVTQSFSTGRVTGSAYAGGLVGFNQGGTVSSSSFWDTQASGQSSSAGGTGLTTAQAQSESYLSTNLGYVFTGSNPVWSISGTEYPVLSWEQ